MTTNPFWCRLFLITAFIAMIGCAQGFPNPFVSPNQIASTPIGAQGKNTLAFSIGSCGANTYVNEPCVSITLCQPGTSDCQTIQNILLDTGSYGLRIFSSSISIPLTQIQSGGGTVSECAQFGTANTWGPIEMAGVGIGNEPVAQVPIQVIDSHFGSVPSQCASPANGPSDTGWNGILGVGLFSYDCGSACAQQSDNQMYYTCSGNQCSGAAIPVQDQVINPVAALRYDNNGVALTIPSIPLGGVISATGLLTIGIGTQSNNTPQNVTTFGADQAGNFNTNFNGKSDDQSFIDSGSNGLFFAGPASLTDCPQTGNDAGFYCPSSTQNLSATIAAANGSPTKNVSFYVGNAATLSNTPNAVFVEFAGSDSTAGEFDWGLPFFMGRTVYIGIDQTPSPIGHGPFWAF